MQPYQQYRTSLRCQFGVSSHRIKSINLDVYRALHLFFMEGSKFFPSASAPVTKLSKGNDTVALGGEFGIYFGSALERSWNLLFSCWAPDTSSHLHPLVCLDHCSSGLCESGLQTSRVRPSAQALDILLRGPMEVVGHSAARAAHIDRANNKPCLGVSLPVGDAICIAANMTAAGCF